MHGAHGCGAAWGPRPIVATLVLEVAVLEHGAHLPCYISAAGSHCIAQLWDGAGGSWGARGVPAEPLGAAAGFQCPALPFLSRFSPVERQQMGLQWGLPLLRVPLIL